MRTTATEVQQHELVTSVCGHVSGPSLTSELSGNSTATDHWQMESVPPRPIHRNPISTVVITTPFCLGFRSSFLVALGASRLVTGNSQCSASVFVFSTRWILLVSR